MGMLDKLMFWKKHDDFGSDFGNTGMDNFNTPGMPNQDNFGLPPQNNFGMPPQDNIGMPNASPQPSNLDMGFQAQRPTSNINPSAPPGFQSPVMPQNQPQDLTVMSKDIELLSYKLDTIKAAIDMLNQRMQNLERLATGEQEKKPRW